jgi:hypothetical protein
MPIPAPPPGFAVHGGTLSYLPRGHVAANSTSHGRATTAQGMAALHDAMQGLPCDQGSATMAAALGARVAVALEDANAGMDVQFVRIGPSAGSRTQMFGGERVCP